MKSSGWGIRETGSRGQQSKTLKFPFCRRSDFFGGETVYFSLFLICGGEILLPAQEINADFFSFLFRREEEEEGRKRVKSKETSNYQLPLSFLPPLLLPPDIERYRGERKVAGFPEWIRNKRGLPASQKTCMCWTTRDGPDTFRAKCAPLLATLNAFPCKTNEKK